MLVLLILFIQQRMQIMPELINVVLTIMSN